MRRLRRGRRGPRRQASTADPVTTALAEAAASGPLIRRLEDLEPELMELPGWFTVADDDLLDGFDTRLDLADEIQGYCDPGDDGLGEALAEQPGITAVHDEDRDVFYLATRLHHADVAAAVIRAIVEVNRNPRPLRAMAGEVTVKQVAAFTDAVAPLVTAAGFIRRSDGRYFHRDCGDGVVQVIGMVPGRGERGNGTSLHGTVEVRYGVCIPEAQYYPMPADTADVPLGYATLSSATYPAPDPASVTDALQETVLPWLEGTAGRSALAAGTEDNPELIFPPAIGPLISRLLAEWGHPTAARALLDHLDLRWPSLDSDPDTRAARDLLGDT